MYGGVAHGTAACLQRQQRWYKQLRYQLKSQLWVQTAPHMHNHDLVLVCCLPHGWTPLYSISNMVAYCHPSLQAVCIIQTLDDAEALLFLDKNFNELFNRMPADEVAAVCKRELSRLSQVGCCWLLLYTQAGYTMSVNSATNTVCVRQVMSLHICPEHVQ